MKSTKEGDWKHRGRTRRFCFLKKTHLKVDSMCEANGESITPKNVNTVLIKCNRK